MEGMDDYKFRTICHVGVEEILKTCSSILTLTNNNNNTSMV